MRTALEAVRSAASDEAAAADVLGTILRLSRGTFRGCSIFDMPDLVCWGSQ